MIAGYEKFMEKRKILAGYEHLIGGYAGGAVSTIICHPFDLLKARYSANEGSALRPQYRSYFHAATSVVKANGVRGLYQGLTPNIIAAPLSWGLYFQLYHLIRPRVELFENRTADNLFIGALTGTIVLIPTNPFWVAKTRLCLQYENEGVRKYKGMIDCFRQIIRYEGWRGLYKGFTPGIIGTVNGSIQFAIYNALKDWFCEIRGIPQDSQLEGVDYLFCSITSKVLATMITFPYQVVRTRLQDHHTDYRGIWDVIRRTYRGEGWRGFYKGGLMAIVKQTPNSVITYMVYEYVKHELLSLNED